MDLILPLIAKLKEVTILTKTYKDSNFFYPDFNHFKAFLKTDIANY